MTFLKYSKIFSKLLLPSITISSSLNLYNIYNNQNDIDYKYFHYCYSSV